MSEELKPCPFCGGEPNPTHDDYVHDDLRPMPVIECKSCSAWVRAEDWNRRAQPAEAEGPVEMGSDAWMALHLLDRLDVSADEEPRVQQVEEIVRRMGAALSAVTAERDRLLHSQQVLMQSRNAHRDERDQLRAEVERLTKIIATQQVRKFVGQHDQLQIDGLVALGIEQDRREIERLRAEVAALRKDAVAGAVVWKFIDRMGDPAECDPAETILAEFVAAFDAAMAAKEA